MTKKHLTIAGMTCNHCVMSVRKALAGVDGLEVEDVRIGAADVEYMSEEIREQALIDAVRNAGFQVVSIS